MRNLLKILCIPLILALLLVPAIRIDAPAVDSANIAPILTPTLPVNTPTHYSSTITTTATHGSSTAFPDYFTIVAIPDTQVYSESYPDIFYGQTQWIVDHQSSENIVAVVHEGDIINRSSDTSQWSVARTAMKILTTANIPYIITPGNHDSENGIYPNGYFNTYLYPDFIAQSVTKDVYPLKTLQNSYILIDTMGQSLIIINIDGWDLSAPTEAWLNTILSTYGNREAIILTHGYIDNTGAFTTAFDAPPYGARGQKIFDDIVKLHSKVIAVMCGHYGLQGGTGYSISIGIDGNTIQNILADYQNYDNGGNGYLRLYRFYPASGKIEVHTYSTLNSSELTDANNRFDIPYVPRLPDWIYEKTSRFITYFAQFPLHYKVKTEIFIKETLLLSA